MPVEPKLLPLVEPIGSRFASLTQDSRLINAFAEKGEGQGEAFVYKRPAFILSTAQGPGTARGLFNWQGSIYAIIGGTIYKNGVALGTGIQNAGSYSFAPCLGASPKLFIQNGAVAYTIDAANNVVLVNDANYPASVTPGAVYIDGTIYVMDFSAVIHGSAAAQNNPAAWDPLNTLVAQIEPQPPVCCAKQLVYFVAIKANYAEVFFDAGNATGSPLATFQGAKMNYGCADARTLSNVGGDLAWLASTGEGSLCAVVLSNLKLDVVSTPAVERILSTGTVGSFYSWNARVEGHRFYGITNVNGNFTLVFDATSRLWYQWADSNGNYLPYAYSCPGNGASQLFLHATNGNIYTLDGGTYKDAADTGQFACQIYTPNFDGGTRRSKTLGRLDFVGDQTAVSTTVSVAYSDNDYQTWTTHPDTFDLSLDRPSIAGFGSFTKRAFSITHQANTAFRVKGIEMYIDVGAS